MNCLVTFENTKRGHATVIVTQNGQAALRKYLQRQSGHVKNSWSVASTWVGECPEDILSFPHNFPKFDHTEGYGWSYLSVSNILYVLQFPTAESSVLRMSKLMESTFVVKDTVKLLYTQNKERRTWVNMVADAISNP